MYNVIRKLYGLKQLKQLKQLRGCRSCFPRRDQNKSGLWFVEGGHGTEC